MSKKRNDSMKKIVILTLLTALLSSQSLITSYAEDKVVAEALTEQAIETTVYMDVTEGVEYALNHSLSLASEVSGIYTNKYSYGDALKTYNNYIKRTNEASTFDTGLLVKKYYVELAKLQYDSTERAFDTAKLKLKNDVTAAFYTYYNCVEKEKLAKVNLDNANEKMTFQKARLDNGIISQLDYELFELSVMSAENALDAAKRDTELALISIKNIINFEAGKELVITGELPEIEVSYVNADEAIELSRTQNSYITLTQNHEIAKKRWDFAQNYYFPAEHGYSIEKYTYETACSDYQMNVNNIDNGIRQTYYTLLNLEDNIEYSQKYVDYQKKSTDVAYTKYEMGMITANTYVETEQSYFKAQNDLMDLKLSYRNTALSYKAMYSVE